MVLVIREEHIEKPVRYASRAGSWSAPHVEILKERYLNFEDVGEIAQDLNRTEKSVWNKLYYLGITRGKPSYDTHYWCKFHGWFMKEDVQDRRCPECNRCLRQSKRG